MDLNKLKDVNVLLVEDEYELSSSLKSAIGEYFYSFTLASNGIDGLKEFENNKVDLVITDINMPNMNGLELVKKIRAEDKYVDIPIIMVTTEGGKAEVITALKAGVNNYIVKPFSADILKEKLDGVIKK